MLSQPDPQQGRDAVREGAAAGAGGGGGVRGEGWADEVDLKFGTLFSGIGGFDLGFERAGLECAWQVEINKSCLSVLAKRWPDVLKHEDVRTFNVEEPVDLICGGFPCQDLSVAGHRAGLAGERSGLWHEFHRIVASARPRWVVVENVPGLLSSNAGRDFAVILRGLVECGYGVCWRILDAQYFGVAQRRRRVFIVGSLGDGRAATVLFESEGGTGDTPPRREVGARVAEDVAVGINGSGLRGRQPGSAATYAYTIQEADYAVFAWQQGATENDRSYPVRKGQYAGALSETRVDAVSGPMGVRRLTPTECERLQGFPDGWTDLPQSDSVRYRQLGNAVCVPVAEWIGKQLLEQMRLI